MTNNEANKVIAEFMEEKGYKKHPINVKTTADEFTIVSVVCFWNKHYGQGENTVSDNFQEAAAHATAKAIQGSL